MDNGGGGKKKKLWKPSSFYVHLANVKHIVSPLEHVVLSGALQQKDQIF